MTEKITFRYKDQDLTGELVRYWRTDSNKPWRNPVIVRVGDLIYCITQGDIFNEADRLKLTKGLRNYSDGGRHLAINLHLYSESLPTEVSIMIDTLIHDTRERLHSLIERLIRLNCGEEVRWSVESWLSDASQVVGDIDVYQVEDDDLVMSGFGREGIVFTETWSGPIDPALMQKYKKATGDTKDRITVRLTAPPAHGYRDSASVIWRAQLTGEPQQLPQGEKP